MDMSRFFETTMNPEQRPSGPLQPQLDPDSSRPDAEPGQRLLNMMLRGWLAVETIGSDGNRYEQMNANRRFARSVCGLEGGGAGSLRRQDDRRWRFAP